MKVLIVCSGNVMDENNSNFKLKKPFIYEQIEELKK
jgi:hypothetical protein